MKIVNFKKHDIPYKCNFDKFYETHSFDLEIEVPEGTLVWQGWSIREHIKGGNLRLQGPMTIINGKYRPALLYRGRDLAVIQILVRRLLLEEFGIDIPMPDRNAPEASKIDQKEKNDSSVKTWRVRPKKPLLKRN